MKILRIETNFKVKGKNLKVLVLFASIFTSAAILLLILFNLSKDNSNNREVKVDDENIVTYSTDTPSEEPIEESYYVNPQDPRLIKITESGIRGFIQKVGIDQNNEIAVPNNVMLAGWYINSVKPGKKGLSIIDGHVDGTSIGGIFANLKNVERGQIIEVEYGNGEIIQYKVIEKIQVNLSNAYEVLFSKRTEIESQLNLITCGGNFDYTNKTYDDRIIVISERI